jgi:hypothetical protein
VQQLDDSFNTYITLCLDSLLTFQNRTLTTIGDGAFEECPSLITVRLAYGATGYGLRSFPEGVTKTFFGAGVPDWTVDPSATDVVVPDGVPMIPSAALKGCTLLTSFVVSDSVTAIGDNAFYGCSLLTSFVGSDSVTAIGDYAFNGCSSLTSFVVSNSVTAIGDSAFEGCSSLTSFVVSDSVTAIGDGAFFECSSLTTASIPAGATLGDDVFEEPTTVTTRD